MIAIIDYDAGNIKSVEKAFQYIGEDTVVSRDKDVILSADKVASFRELVRSEMQWRN